MTDPDNPLPEPSFHWRRWVTIGYVVATTILLALIVWKLTEGGPLRDIALALIGSQAFFALMYMGGASASPVSSLAGKSHDVCSRPSIPRPLARRSS
jgi:hypothetical protein